MARKKGRATPLSVGPAAGAGDHHRAAPNHDVPAAGAGDHQRDDRRPPRRAHWDVVECIWRYARGLGHNIGSVLQFLLRGRGTAGDHIAERAGDHVVANGQGKRVRHQHKNHAFMYGAYHSGKQAHPENPAPAEAPPESSTSSSQAPPESPLMVGDETVWGEELCQYALYCQKSLTCGRNKILCHRCIFEPIADGRDKIRPPDMLVHCQDKHIDKGIQCQENGCMVRVGTPRELPLHIRFCHELHTGWWEEDFYKRKMKIKRTT